MSNPTKLRPLLPLTSTGPPPPAYPPSSAPKRKRPQVTAACNGCRKRKVKCDGARPSCYSCSAAKIPCVYPVPEGLSQREAQKQKLNHVSRAHESSRSVLELLRASRDGATHDILKQLQHAEHLDETIQAIADASLLLPKGGGRPDPSLDAAPQRRDSFGSSLHRRASGSSDGSLRSIPADVSEAAAPAAAPLPVSQWTPVCQDDRLLTHLIDLFWVWDSTLSRLIDHELFVADLSATKPSEATAPGQPQQSFCSPFLVNALLAVSSLHATRGRSSLVPADIASLGDKFAAHAFDLLEREKDDPSTTLLQGLAFLWVFVSNDGSPASRRRRESLAGLLQQTWSALGGGLDDSKLFKSSFPPSGDEEQGDRLWKAASYMTWGFYCFFAKMSLVFAPHMLAPKPVMMKSFEGPEDPTFGGGSPGSSSSVDEGFVASQATHQMQVFSAECSLCEIVDQFVSSFDGDGRPHAALDGGRCTALYNKLLCWKLALPDHLTTSNSVLPSVLMLQSAYDFVALKLLVHFSDQQHPSPPAAPAEFDGRSVPALQALHAGSAMTHLWIYRGLYAPKHDYWAAEHAAAAAAALLPRLQAEPATRDVVARACCVLDEAGSGRARALLADLEGRARREGIRLPSYGRQGTPGVEEGGPPGVVVRGAQVFDGGGGVLDGCEVGFRGTITDVRPAREARAGSG